MTQDLSRQILEFNNLLVQLLHPQPFVIISNFPHLLVNFRFELKSQFLLHGLFYSSMEGMDLSSVLRSDVYHHFQVAHIRKFLRLLEETMPSLIGSDFSVHNILDKF